MSEEVRHIEKYIEIQKVRYASFLTSDIIVDPEYFELQDIKAGFTAACGKCDLSRSQRT